MSFPFYMSFCGSLSTSIRKTNPRHDKGPGYKGGQAVQTPCATSLKVLTSSYTGHIKCNVWERTRARKAHVALHLYVGLITTAIPKGGKHQIGYRIKGYADGRR